MADIKGIGYGYIREIPFGFDKALEKTKEALKEQGFGVLAEIDVSKALKDKLNVDMPRYLILGACNPQLAHQALQKEKDLGLLLPCNVTVREIGASVSEVGVIDARQMLNVVGNDNLKPVATEASARLSRALEKIGS